MSIKTDKEKAAKERMLSLGKDWKLEKDNVLFRKAYYDSIGEYCKLIANKPHKRYASHMITLYNNALLVCDDNKEKEKIIKFIKVLKVAQKVLG